MKVITLQKGRSALGILYIDRLTNLTFWSVDINVLEYGYWDNFGSLIIILDNSTSETFMFVRLISGLPL
jgi:hypothetical protein